ncbi:MAC/perforin domain-containing protein (plasmid) [Azospirillum sp. HJ39]|uniref:MAC/perforin domain-containing protein n=1 Tax=Azospirillum sp. HJ39 TaxID=3159496 RepID=UPI003558E037
MSSEPATPPPADLIQAFSLAFNMKTGSFGGSQIFDLTYNENITQAVGPVGLSQTYSVPDGINMLTLQAGGFETSNTQLYTSKQQFTDAFNLSIGGEFSYLGFEASANVGIRSASEILSDGSSYMALNIGGQTVYTAEWAEQPAPTAGMKADLLALMQNGSAASYQSFVAFFEKYGTHYLKRAAFGGYYALQTTISSSQYQSSTESSLTANIGLAYSGVVASGKLSVDLSSESSTIGAVSSEVTAMSVTTVGGSFNQDLQTFMDSIIGDPAVLVVPSGPPARFVPLSALVLIAGGSQALATAFNSALVQYLGLGSGQMSAVFDGPVHVRPNQIFQATSDGFVTVNLRLKSTAAATNNCTAQIFTDSSPQPTTLRTAAAVQATLSMTQSTCMSPVREGDYYFVQLSAPQQVAAKIEFLPLLASSGLSLGSWANVSGGAPTTATSDCIAVANFQAGNQNSGNLCLCNNQTNTSQIVASSAFFNPGYTIPCYIGVIGCALPVQNSNTFSCNGRNVIQRPVGPTSPVYSLPITQKSNAAVFGATVVYTPGLAFTPSADGFLIVLSSASSGTSNGSVAAVVSSGADNEIIGNALAAQMPSVGGVYFPYASFCAPVPLGSEIRVNINTTGPGGSVNVWWVPIAT